MPEHQNQDSATPDQQIFQAECDLHRASIRRRAGRLIDEKYIKGQKEHGGRLWTKPGLIDMAIDEAVDQVIYLLTLKDQIENPEIVDHTARDVDAT